MCMYDIIDITHFGFEADFRFGFQYTCIVLKVKSIQVEYDI